MLRLSIIIPFFNVERYIAQCLDSVFDQDIPESEYEVICVDDLGQDQSLSIVEAYVKQHSNLRIVRNAINRKLGGARNSGMEVAQGRYVWYIDSDDFIEPNVFGRLLEEAGKEDLDVLHFNYEWYPDRNNSSNHRVENTELMSGPEMFFDKRFIWYHDLVTAWRKIYKRQFLIDNHIEFGEHIMFEDNDYAIQVFAKAKRVCHIQLNCYNYRNNPESITRVRVTSNHIDYWLKVCHRLSVFRQQFLIEGIDLRFQKLIDSFIRYELRHVVEMYHQLAKDEREVAKQIIRKGCDKSMRQYMPVKMYYKVRFGLL